MKQVRYSGAVAELLREARLSDLPAPSDDERGTSTDCCDPGEALLQQREFRLPAQQAP